MIQPGFPSPVRPRKLGHITEWFYKDLAGIDCDPAGPGFKQIVIRPRPVADLSWVRATYNSIRGPISVHWEQSYNEFQLSTTIPANTTATVWLPAADADRVTEGGQPVDGRAGVRFLRIEDDHAVFRIESGAYGFASKR